MIRVYHHIYPTKIGVQIAEKQKERINKNIIQKFEYVPNIVKKYETEIWTLKKLQNDCLELSDDTFILYIHTKGATKPTIEREQWREYMELELIDNYKFHLDILSKGFSSSGVLMGIPYWSITSTGNNFYGGNFWWTTAGYIKSLPKDLGWGDWNLNSVYNKHTDDFGNWISWAEIKFLNQGKNFNPYTIPFFNVSKFKEFSDLIVDEIIKNKKTYDNLNIKNKML